VIVACLKVQFLIPGCTSLKEKRFILSSLKTRLRNKFNIAICECGYQDKWQRSEVAMATVASGRKGVDRTTQSIKTFLEREHRIVLLEFEKEFY
jgi:uncharacterized protein YlxP (DUF503 family)